MNKIIDRNIFLILIVFGFWSFFNSANGFAEVVRTDEIRTFYTVTQQIRDILDHTNFGPENILVVSDWDQVISRKNGTNLPLREESTATDVGWIFQKKVPFIILTSRVCNLTFRERDQRLYAQYSQEMGRDLSSELSEKWHFGRSRERNYLSPRLSQPILGGFNFVTTARYFAVGVNGVIFTRPKFISLYNDETSKGIALAHAIDSGWLSVHPKVIIFVDDSDSHIEDVKSVFSSRAEKVFLFHFPRNY